MRYLITIALLAVAQIGIGQKSFTSTKVLKIAGQLQMPGSSGSNGCCVIHLAHRKQYAAAFAGNQMFPMAFFNDKDFQLRSDEDRVTEIDMRTMYVRNRKIYGVPYGGDGIYNLPEADGEAPQIVTSDLGLPFNSTGAYNDIAEELLFLEEGRVFYLNLKKTNNNLKEEDWEDIVNDGNHNITTLIVKAEKKKTLIGFLNIANNRVEWYNQKSKKKEEEWLLPKDLLLNNLFNFSYANGIVWIFDKAARTWLGFK